MLQNTHEKQIYIVVSQTGTLLSKILKIITGDEYNHVSLSLDKDLDTMYSFGRRQTYNPFWGGMVQESLHYGTFRRFRKTKAVVMEVPVDGELYYQMKEHLEKMYLERKRYHYNYLGLLLAAIRINYHPTDCYYCSSFVKEILVYFNLIESNEMRRIVHPIDFLERFEEQAVYSGKLHEYRAEKVFLS